MMQGRITVTQAGDLRVHTFTAPEKGWRFNSHIIELPSQLLVIDSQYLLPYAHEVVSYCAQLQKPNGQPFRLPAPCSVPTWEKREPADYSSFRSTTVPEGTFSVVGDNLEDSYDSRLREFGAVTADMIRGRPLYFYCGLPRSFESTARFTDLVF
jgi:hypothetical protein